MNIKNKRSVSRVLHSLCSSLYIISLLFIVPEAHAQFEKSRKIWSPNAYHTFISKISYPLNSISITVNGKPVEAGSITMNDYDGTVHFKIPLGYGVSSLITINSGYDILFTADVFYAPSYESRIVPEEYELNPFHIEEKEKSCLACHRLSPDESDKVPAKPADSLCFPCHNSEFAGLTFQHREAGITWECLRCHQAEAMEPDYAVDGPVKFTIKEGNKVASLCYECHKKSEKEYLEFKFVHGPVAIGICNMCHNPHGSYLKNFMNEDISARCIECHEKQEMMSQPNIHPPLIKQGCTGCHNPHGSDSPFFLALEIKEVCMTCHPKTEEQKNNHPVEGHPVSGPQDPINTDRKLSCVSCHNPHSSEFDHLLPVNEVMMLCVRCHKRG